jgi:PAS domain S-box-containing protein
MVKAPLRLGTPLASLALAVVYAAAAYGSLRLFALVNAQASPVWPPTGIAIAALVLWGIRLWPGVLAGAFVANLLVALDPLPGATQASLATAALSSLAIAGGNVIEAVAAAAIVRSKGGGGACCRSATAAAWFIAAALLAPVASASVGAATLVAAGQAAAAEAGTVWLTWWLGDVGGALVVAPFAIAWMAAPPRIIRATEWLGIQAAAATAAVLVFVADLEVLRNAPLSFLLLPFVAWSAMRLQLHGVAVTVALVAVAATAGTVARVGPFAVLPPHAALLALQAYLAVVASTGILLASTSAENRHTQAELKGERTELERRVLERTLAIAAKQAEVEFARKGLEEAQAMAHLGSWTWDVPQNKVEWSAELCRIYGVPPGSERSYDGYLALLHPDDRAAVDATVRRAFATGGPFEVRHRIVRPDGTTRWVIGNGRAEQDAAGKVVRMSGTALDVTELRTTEERFRTLLEASPDAYVVADAAGRIVLANRQAERLFGYERDELLRLAVEDLVPEALRQRHVGHRAHFMAAPSVRPMGIGMDLRARRKDGSEVPVEISLSPLATADGMQVFAAVRDITDRKRAEAEVAETRRLAAANEKLAALGTLVAGVGHEVRTPLTYIATNAALVRLRIEKAAATGAPAAGILPEVERPLASIREGVGRIDRIVQQMRQFAKAELKAEVGSLEEAVAGALELWRATHRGGTEVEATLQPLPRMRFDKGQVQQVLINLLNNASEAMGGGGRATVRVGPDRGQALVEVADHGPGIPPDVQRRVWDPFFTTKPEGTGLGLSVSRRIVEAHGGSLAYETSSRGTTFRVRLPLEPPAGPPGSGPEGAA